jgi:isopentenyldiphosphate isomerase
MTELWQLYDEQGRPLIGKGETKDNVLGKGLLHGASHVWIWRKVENEVEILLQKRASEKRTWPSHYDISAAGHIDLGEDPITAAIRETKEEIGHSVADSDLRFIGTDRRLIATPDGKSIENEICWLYILKLEDSSRLSLDDGELDSVIWKKLEDIKAEVANGDKYVPHGTTYYDTVFGAVEGLCDE